MANGLTHQHVTDPMRACAEECHACHDVCLETITICLHEGGAHAAADVVRLLMDCAQICHAAGDFVLRGSDMHPHVCRACAEVCQRCANQCERMSGGPDGAHMKACAVACQRCAASCRDMAG